MREMTSQFMKMLLAVVVLVALSSCATNDQAHTTVVTRITAPPHQVVTVVSKLAPTPSQTSSKPSAIASTADPHKPLLLFHLENGQTFRPRDEVPIVFSVLNAKLKAEGGDFRVRYIVDDDDMKWLESAEPFWLAGWIPGKHTIRIELIGPDGWPYKNGNANIVTKEIQVVE
jgi:hypothetical protein